MAAVTAPAALAEAARWSGAELRTHAPSGDCASLSMQLYDDEYVPVERTRPAEAVGGFLAAAAITLSVVAVAYRPVRVIPFALVIAFIAVALTRERHARLAAAAVVVGALGWLAGMTVAILTERPLY